MQRRMSRASRQESIDFHNMKELAITHVLKDKDIKEVIASLAEDHEDMDHVLQSCNHTLALRKRRRKIRHRINQCKLLGMLIFLAATVFCCASISKWLIVTF